LNVILPKNKIFRNDVLFILFNEQLVSFNI
jgi:hypothetical protein